MFIWLIHKALMTQIKIIAFKMIFQHLLQFPFLLINVKK